jgi:hypothetical protein
MRFFVALLLRMTKRVLLDFVPQPNLQLLNFQLLSSIENSGSLVRNRTARYFSSGAADGSMSSGFLAILKAKIHAAKDLEGSL